MSATDLGLDLSRYKLGWSDEEDYVFKPKKGLNEDIIREMSWICLLYTSPSPRDLSTSRMPSSA